MVNPPHLSALLLTVHLVLSADPNLLPPLDVQEEVGGLLPREMTEIHIIYLQREGQLQNETPLLHVSHPVSVPNLSHLHDLVSLLHPLVVGRAVGLNAPDKYAHVVSPHQPQAHAVLLHKLYGVDV